MTALSYILRRSIILITILFSSIAIATHLQGDEKSLPIKYQKATLDNGLRVIMVEHHELPVVAVELLVKAGSAYDPQGRPGLANLVAQLLREGTRHKTSLEISEEIDFIGGTLDVNCDYDSTSISATALTRHFQTIVDLLSEVARYPSFQPEAIDFQKDKTITSIIRERDSKRAIASRHFNEMLYGPHPYAHPPSGTVDGVRAITREDIVWFHRRYYLPNNSILTVVGDIEPEQVLAHIKKALGEWKGEEVEGPVFHPIPKISGYRIRLVDKPDLTQTEIRIGHLGIRRTDPEYFPLLLLNRILGEGPTSRLYRSIRVERGLSYGVRSRFEPRVMRGPFSVRTFSKNETALETLWLVLEELRRLKYGGVTEEELGAAKAYYTGHFPLGLETPSQIATKIIEQEFYALPEDYLERYLDNIRAVSLRDVNRIAGELLDPENLVIVLVSRAADILSDARMLGDVEVKKP